MTELSFLFPEVKRGGSVILVVRDDGEWASGEKVITHQEIRGFSFLFIFLSPISELFLTKGVNVSRIKTLASTYTPFA